MPDTVETSRGAATPARAVPRSLLAFLTYLALTLALTSPLVASIAASVPHDLGDPVLNIWLLSWNARHLPFSATWWDGPLFHPVTGTLAFSEHLVGLSPITSPTLWLGGSPVLAYNLALLLSFPLSGLSLYWLGRELTGRDGPAFVGGLAYAFAPYRLAQLGHLDILSWYWAPLALLGLHRYERTRAWPNLVLFAAAWLMQVLCKQYAFFYLSAVVALWMLWFGPRAGGRTTLRIAGAWAAAIAAVAPLLLHYRSVHATYGLQRFMFEIEEFSADVRGLLLGSPLLAHWPWPGTNIETSLFPGITLLILLPLGTLAVLRPLAPDDRYRRLRLALAAVAAIAAWSAACAAIFGPWALAAGPVRLSVRALHKPLAFTWLLLLALAVTHPRFRAALRARSRLAFYFTAALACWLLSLGPAPHAFGTPIWDKAPYWWLLKLPGFSSLRVPARFWISVVLCLSVAVVLVLARLVERWPRVRTAALAGVGLALVWDGWPRELPLHAAPPRSPVLERLGSPSEPVLELPLGIDADAAALYRQIFHGHPVVNGLSGHQPPHYALLQLGLERREGSPLMALAEERPLLVRVDRANDRDGAWERWLAERPAAVRVESPEDEAVYKLVVHTPRFAHGARLPIRTVTANVDGGDVARIIDGDETTFWRTHTRQAGHERVVLDLGETRRIGALVLSIGRFFMEHPRKLRIDVSDDGTEWRTVWRGGTTGAALVGCLADPRQVQLRFVLQDAAGRYVRLHQFEKDPAAYWCIGEAALFLPPESPPS